MATDYFGLSIPFLDHLGLLPGEYGDRKASTRLPKAPSVGNSRGEYHGGALMSALDFTMSAAARASYSEPMGAATIDMSCSFIAPAEGEVVIEATCVKPGRSLAFCEGRVVDTKGRLVARAHGTFKMLPGNTR